MTEIEQIFPYTIVSDDKGYGIVDSKGDFVVPCEMDDIVNAIYEDAGLELWADYGCVFVVKDGMVGFFTDNGKFIEPAYYNYYVDPCGGDIHVGTEDGYGIFRAPDYVFEEIEAEESLLPDEDTEDYVEVDIDDVDSSDSEEYLEAGYNLAESIWDNEYADLDGDTDLQEYVDQVIDTIYEEFISCKSIIGASEFITPKCVGSADVPLLNKTIKKLCNDSHKDGYYSLFRTIDTLLPHPEYNEEAVIRFSVGNRPVFSNGEYEGEIGDIFLYEHGMHMFYVTVNIYDSESPDKMIKGCQLLDLADIRLSELLACLQNAIDPDKTNKELSANIIKASKLEEQPDLGYILKDCGISMLKTRETYVHWWDTALLVDVTGFMSCVYVSAEGQLNMIIDDGGSYPLDVELLPTNPYFTTILETIKETVNIACNN